MSGSNRKFGRSKTRPSNVRYTSEKRWLKNKMLAIKREDRKQAKCNIRKILRLPESSRNYELLQSLRHIVAQSMPA